MDNLLTFKFTTTATVSGSPTSNIAEVGLPRDAKTGKIMVFTNLGHSKLDMSANFFGTLNLNGNNLINVQKIIGMDGKWKIDENGHLVVKTVEAEEIKATKKFEVGSTQKPTAITVYDEHGKTGCLKIQSVDSGAMQLAAGACGAEAAQITVSETSATSSASTTSQ